MNETKNHNPPPPPPPLQVKWSVPKRLAKPCCFLRVLVCGRHKDIQYHQQATIHRTTTVRLI